MTNLEPRKEKDKDQCNEKYGQTMRVPPAARPSRAGRDLIDGATLAYGPTSKIAT
jgi:hypothetical protein